MAAFYIGIVERGADGGFGVFFPDFPGCVSAGDTFDEVVEGGQEALELHVAGMREDGLDIPAASGAFNVNPADYPDADIYRIVGFAIEDAKAARDPAVRVNVSLPESLIARIDAAAAEAGLNRSSLLALGARQWLTANRKTAA